jgi:hypothetical protein
MFIDGARKVCYLLVSKNASSSFETVLNRVCLERVDLKKASVDELMEGHVTPKVICKYQPEISNYTFYGFFRDPAERLASALRYVALNRKLLDSKLPNEDFCKMNYKNFLELMPLFKEAMSVVFLPQTEWYVEGQTVVNDYRLFNEKIISLVKSYGREHIWNNFGGKMPPLANKSYTTNNLNDYHEVVEYAKEHYAKDYEILKECV